MSSCIESYLQFSECSRCGSNFPDTACRYGVCPIETQVFCGGFVTPVNQINTSKPDYKLRIGCERVPGSNQMRLTQVLIAKHESETKAREQKLAETYAWITKCEHTNGLCGCFECKEYKDLALKRGVKDFELLACKLMDLDTGAFYWDEDRVMTVCGF